MACVHGCPAMLRTRAADRLATGARRMCTVPITHVARIVRMHVASERQAAKADAVVVKMRAALEEAAPPGYAKMVRTVCKTEWAYETAIVFRSLDDFKARRA